MKRPALAAGLVVLLSTGCREGQPLQRAATPTPSPVEGGRLKPLTSRDDDSPPAAQPGPTQGLPPGHPPMAGAPTVAPASGEAVSGTVAIAPRLKDRQGRALFIIARSAGSGQILAVRKEEDFRFPASFRISGVDAMVEGTAFVGPFDITARLSKTGDAMPGAGDVEGSAKAVAAGVKDVAIVLDTVRQ